MSGISFGLFGAMLGGIGLYALSDAAGATALSPVGREAPAGALDPLPVNFEDFGSADLTIPAPVIDFDQAPDAAGNITAFLFVLRQGESSDDYQALVGGGRFSSFAQHPAFANPAWQGWRNSHAAGAYQFQPGTWLDFVESVTGAADKSYPFTPANQDAAALWAIERRGATADVKAGAIDAAMFKLRSEWTSLADRGRTWVVSTFESQGGSLA